MKVQIWWIFAWAVESLKFCPSVSSLCPNHIKFQLKKFSLMTMNSETKFKEKLTCGFKYDIRNLVNFHPTTQKSENFFSMGSFCPKYARSEEQKYRGVIFHDTEQWCKIWINPDPVVSRTTWGIGWNFITALKSL